MKLYYRCSYSTKLTPLRTHFNLTLQTSHHSEAVFAYTTLLSIYDGCQLCNCLFQLAIPVDHDCSRDKGDLSCESIQCLLGHPIGDCKLWQYHADSCSSFASRSETQLRAASR